MGKGSGGGATGSGGGATGSGGGTKSAGGGTKSADGVKRERRSKKDVAGGNGSKKVVETESQPVELPVVEPPKVELSVAEPPKVELPVAEPPKVELPVVEPPPVELKAVSPTRKAKLNCWEFRKCGREPGGAKAEELGVCPVTTATSFDGLHGGTNAGRACWAVPFPCEGGKVSFASKIRSCTKCEFHHLVIQEEEKYQSALKHLKKFNKEEKAKFVKEQKSVKFKQPGLVRHIFEKSKHTAYGEDAEVESLFITLLIGWVSLCPSVSFLEGSKRICKDDLVDELMIIDAIADNPRRRAAKTVATTMIKAVGKQITRYFDPLVDVVKDKIKK